MTDRIERVELDGPPTGGLTVTAASTPTGPPARVLFDEHGNVVSGPPPARGFGEPRRRGGDPAERVQVDADSRS